MMTFDRKFARVLLECCRYTYSKAFEADPTDAADKQDATDAMDWLNKNVGPAEVKMVSDGKQPSTSVACVFAYPDKNIVSYMGTKTKFNKPKDAVSSILDWGQNLETLPVPFRLSAAQLGVINAPEAGLGGLVHKGFLEELSAVQEKVIGALERPEIGGRGRALYLTGHSQGGAEATLATRAFLYAGYPVAATYTFAAPRSGDEQFARSIPATFPFHRIEFGDDIVPHVPPKALSATVEFAARALLGHVAPQLLDLMNKVRLFVGAGRLCYGSPETKCLRVDIDRAGEDALFMSRLGSLARDPQNWAEHHHLAGTSADVQAGRKGNYTALVSDYTLTG